MRRQAARRTEAASPCPCTHPPTSVTAGRLTDTPTTLSDCMLIGAADHIGTVGNSSPRVPESRCRQSALHERSTLDDYQVCCRLRRQLHSCRASCQYLDNAFNVQGRRRPRTKMFMLYGSEKGKNARLASDDLTTDNASLKSCPALSVAVVMLLYLYCPVFVDLCIDIISVTETPAYALKISHDIFVVVLEVLNLETW
mgnify:CR=1 FL=1|mmetsp:Transcript_11237/g.34625  ORF Transcript_11237/g.34625 Transcript_11237/m.34625 type:complete len:198 (+) Transcript_11237:553-1146(+)